MFTGVFIHTLVCFYVCVQCVFYSIRVYSVQCSAVVTCVWQGMWMKDYCIYNVYSVFYSMYTFFTVCMFLLYMCIICVCVYAQCSAVMTYVVFDRHAGEGLLQQQGCSCGSGHLHLSQSGVGQSRLYSTVQPDARWVTVRSRKRSLYAFIVMWGCTVCLHCYVSMHCMSSLLCE